MTRKFPKLSFNFSSEARCLNAIQVYMTFVQATTGGGGWPLSLWLTPALTPVYGGTYFPPKGSFGRPGFSQVSD